MDRIRTFLVLSACCAELSARPAAAQARFESLYDFAGTNPVGTGAVGASLFVPAWQVTSLTNWTCGTVSELQPAPGGVSWVGTTIYAFAKGGDACYPTAAPIAGLAGGLFGTTEAGGANDDGVLYELQPPAAPGGPWTETVLYSFNREDGRIGGTGNPSPPARGPNGSFYCNAGGGAYGFGAFVQLQPPSAPGGTWTETDLYDYPGEVGIGALVPGPGGVFYGTNWGGTIAQLSPPAASGGSWSETILYTLTGSDGLSPNTLTLASDGILFRHHLWHQLRLRQRQRHCLPAHAADVARWRLELQSAPGLRAGSQP